jgi:pimeloyl-ACP methyl ester carboxylesterase
VPDLVKSDGGVIHYELHGPVDAPTIVLIEGLSGHMVAWRDGFFAPFVDAGFAVVRFDNRDVGRSQHYPNQTYDLQDMAQDVHELIAQLRIAPAHVVAQSMGGMIAQRLMLSNPEDVASATLFYTAASPAHVLGNARSVETLNGIPRPATREEAIELYVEQERLCASTAFPFDEEWKRELGGLMWDRDHDRDGVARQARALFDHQVDLSELKSVTIPTLLIHGTSDRLLSHDGSVELHRAISGSDLWLIEGMGHEIPQQLWPALTDRIIAHATAAEREVTRDLRCS